MGHGGRFSPSTLSGCCLLGEATFVGTHGKGRDAPVPVEEIAAQEPTGAVWANQFDNLANRRGHYETTGPEIWRKPRVRDPHHSD